MVALFVVAMSTPGVHATTFIPESGCKIVSFAKGSAALSNETRAELARTLPRLQSLELGAVVIHAWGDRLKRIPEDLGKQEPLADRRATALKDFFLAQGINQKVVFWSSDWARPTPLLPTRAGLSLVSRSLKSSAGIAVVEYMGQCSAGHEGICAQIRKTCENHKLPSARHIR